MRPHSYLRHVFLVALIVVGLGAAPAFPTTIVIIRTNSGFIIAADSATSDNSGHLLPTSACKIHVADNGMIWGTGGIRHLPDGSSVDDLIRPLFTGQDIRVVSNRIKDKMKPALADAAVFLQRCAPERFRELVDGDVMLSLYIATAERVITQSYSVLVRETGTPTISVVAGVECIAGRAECKPHITMVRIGLTKDMDRFTADHRATVAAIPDDAELLRFLIGIQADATPQKVSRPIDILEINSGGSRWISQKNECKQ